MMIELPEVERRIAEIHSLIERQRQLIEDLGRGGCDITSAQIVFDSLRISLYLHLQDRFRLLVMLNVKAARSKTLDRISERPPRGGLPVCGYAPIKASA
jgi:hypothetical protein